jgi:hypothetical protein
MEDDILKNIGVSSGTVIIILIIYKIISLINNKRLHSSCNGHNLDVIVAVNELTEEEKRPTPKPSPTVKANNDSLEIEKIIV